MCYQNFACNLGLAKPINSKISFRIIIFTKKHLCNKQYKMYNTSLLIMNAYEK